MTEISTVDTGTAYGRKPPSYDARLTEVGPGTPMGEALRRYWHPIASSAALTADVPHKTRLLCEDLIVFRDGRGRPGVVAERCTHRGSSLCYGRIEEDGIRCCYHGWKFDCEGRCLEQAGEPDKGRRRDVARQPWYPVVELYGLVFVYMGPPELKPDLPRYDCLERTGDADPRAYQSTWPIPGMTVTGMVQDFNWLQIFENALDAVHATWLHSNHSGYQFAGTGTTGFPEHYYDPYTAAERITYARTELGGKYDQTFIDDADEGTGKEMVWTSEIFFPNTHVLPRFARLQRDAKSDMVIWIVPSDDTHHIVFFSALSTDPERAAEFALGIKQGGKFGWEMSEEELQRFPGDAEAQGSQGPITFHSEETLATSDVGVMLIRRGLKALVDDVEAGRNPPGLTFGESRVRRTESGVFTVESTEPVEVTAAASTSA
jgi:phenylpropionate dioxygenase-like ring-hydroxylating dioxygenase large terminal subunit